MFWSRLIILLLRCKVGLHYGTIPQPRKGSLIVKSYAFVYRRGAPKGAAPKGLGPPPTPKPEDCWLNPANPEAPTFEVAPPYWPNPPPPEAGEGTAGDPPKAGPPPSADDWPKPEVGVGMVAGAAGGKPKIDGSLPYCLANLFKSWL